MNDIVNLLAGQTEELGSEIAWLVNDLKDVKQLIELLRDSQALCENKSIHHLATLVLDKIKNLEDEDVISINKGLTKLNNSVNDLMIEQANKKSTRSTRSTTKQRNRKTENKKVVKIDDNVDNKDKPVVSSDVAVTAQ